MKIAWKKLKISKKWWTQIFKFHFEKIFNNDIWKKINPDLSKDPKGIVIKFPVTQSRPSRNGNDFRAGGGDHHHLPCGIGLTKFQY